LNFRDIDELLAARGVVATYETVRQRCLKFGQQFANEIRHRKGRPGDTWCLDEKFISINGER
jgi:putative transposase